MKESGEGIGCLFACIGIAILMLISQYGDVLVKWIVAH